MKRRVFRGEDTPAMVASRAAAGAAEDDEVTTMSDFDFEPEDAADVLREPIPPETVEAAYRRLRRCGQTACLRRGADVCGRCRGVG